MNNVTNKLRPILEISVLLAIMALGFVLRFHKVGKDSFWLDEAGQAMAAIQPRVIDTLMIVRQHAGAMPLDYLVSRLMASISLDERVMRFPSVLWGTFSIVVCFLLIRELDLPNTKMISFLTGALLAISPFYIQYSQEMRFYAALVFFYILSTLFLTKALKESSIRGWTLYVLFTAIGVYFHPYVLFTIIIGLVFIFGEYVIRKENLQYWLIIKNGIPGFIISSVFLFAIYLPGYLFFNANQSFSSDLNFNLTSVLQGFGLTAIRGGTNLASIGLWHILLMFGTIGGLLLVVAKWREYRQVLYLVFAFLAQFCIIVCLDVYKHYFFSPRQTIHLTLIIFLLVSIFLSHFLSMMKLPYVKYPSLFIIVGIMFVSSWPYTKAVYAYSKGNAGEIVQTIMSDYCADEKVLVFSADYKVVMDYYFLRYKSSNSLLPVTLLANNTGEIRRMVNTTPDVYFIVAPKDTFGDIRSQIADLGYKLYKTKSNVDFLYVRAK